MKLTTLGILISGRGSNMQAIVRACNDGLLPARVGLVVSNRAEAQGIAWAHQKGIKTVVLSNADFPSREAHDTAVVEELRGAGVEWVCLAGYMRLLSVVFLDAFPGRVVNIHPSLLPAFPGLHAQRQALKYGVKVSGCTVHLVDLELDHGPIVVQKVVHILPEDGEDDLAARILEHEHEAYPQALKLLLGTGWQMRGRRIEATETDHVTLISDSHS